MSTPDRTEAVCDGLCVTAADLGVPTTPGAVAYPHPGCPLHSPDQVCGCGYPDQCLLPTHGQISLGAALSIRHRQSRSAGIATLEERLANRLPKGHPDYDPFYDASDDELGDLIPPIPKAGRSVSDVDR